MEKPPTQSDFVFLTKKIRLPRADILEVRPARDGGCLILTERGLSRVLEPFDEVVAALKGDGRATNGGAE